MSDQPTDDELLRRIGSGDRHAFEEYYARNAPWFGHPAAQAVW